MYSLNAHRELFLDEAKSHVINMNQFLVKLEKKPENTSYFFEISRSVHTLKSLVLTAGYHAVGEFTHLIEDLLDAIRHKIILLSNCIQLLFKCCDHLNLLLEHIIQHKDFTLSNELLTEIHHHLEKAPLDYRFDKTDKINNLINLSEELVIKKIKDEQKFSPLISESQYSAMQSRLLPISFIFNRFARALPDLAAQQNKEMMLKTHHGDMKIDRLLVEEVGQAIAHLLRNLIDHSLEKPAERMQMGKPPKGTIHLRANRSKDKAIIEITDDGKGMDIEAIKQEAIQSSLKNSEADVEIDKFIFSALGLSSVNQICDRIGGTIRIVTETNKKPSFYIEIPLTLAIIKSLLISINNGTYAFPIEAIDRLLIIKESDIKNILNKETIVFNNRDVPLIRLRSILGYAAIQQDKYSVVVIQSNAKKIALIVDQVLTTQDIVIKPINNYLMQNKFFSGAALIGAGKMVFILDVVILFQLFSHDVLQGT